MSVYNAVTWKFLGGKLALPIRWFASDGLAAWGWGVCGSFEIPNIVRHPFKKVPIKGP